MPLKEEFITYISQEKRACHTMQGHMRKHLVWSGSRIKRKGKVSARAFTVVSRGKVKRGNINSFELAILNNFSEHWDLQVSLFVWCFALGGFRLEE